MSLKHRFSICVSSPLKVRSASLYCTPETSVTSYVNYIQIKKAKKKKKNPMKDSIGHLICMSFDMFDMLHQITMIFPND